MTTSTCIGKRTIIKTNATNSDRERERETDRETDRQTEK